MLQRDRQGPIEPVDGTIRLAVRALRYIDAGPSEPTREVVEDFRL